MYNDLNDCQKRYLEAVRPHIDSIIPELIGAFKSKTNITQTYFCEICAPKVGMHVDLFKFGFAVLIKENVILGIHCAQRAGMTKISQISRNNSYEFGQCPSAKKNSKFFKVQETKPLENIVEKIPVEKQAKDKTTKLDKPIKHQEKLSLLKKCIREKCLDCMNDSKEDVINCVIPSCALFSVRPYKNKEDTESAEVEEIDLSKGIQIKYSVDLIKEHETNAFIEHAEDVDEDVVLEFAST